MKIAIDARFANRIPSKGVETHMYNLLKHLAEIDHENKYILYLSSPPFDKFPTLNNKNFKYRVLKEKIPKNLDRIFYLLGLPWSEGYFEKILIPLDMALWTRPDIYFSIVHTFQPVFCIPKRVVTVYDLGFLKYTEYHSKWQYTVFKDGTKEGVQKADKIITISNFTKNEVIKEYGIPPEKITTVYFGKNSDLFNLKGNPGEEKEIFNKYNILSPYILFTSVLQPRKNIERLIEAFHILVKEERPENLVISGKKGWLYESILKKAEHLGIKNRVIFTDYVDANDLPVLMRNAKLFVMPSLYEGFALPILEAMACGVPVAASNASAIPEITGDAALLFNPERVEEIKSSILKILTDGQLAAMLRKKGLERCKQFTWGKCAVDTLKVFEEVMKEKRKT